MLGAGESLTLMLITFSQTELQKYKKNEAFKGFWLHNEMTDDFDIQKSTSGALVPQHEVDSFLKLKNVSTVDSPPLCTILHFCQNLPVSSSVRLPLWTRAKV